MPLVAVTINISLLGPVKKCGLFKILHEKFKNRKKFESEFLSFQSTFSEAIEHNKDLEQYLTKAQVHTHTVTMTRMIIITNAPSPLQDILNPLKVLNLFRNIPDEVSW